MNWLPHFNLYIFLLQPSWVGTEAAATAAAVLAVEAGVGAAAAPATVALTQRIRTGSITVKGPATRSKNITTNQGHVPGTEVGNQRPTTRPTGGAVGQGHKRGIRVWSQGTETSAPGQRTDTTTQAQGTEAGKKSILKKHAGQSPMTDTRGQGQRKEHQASLSKGEADLILRLTQSHGRLHLPKRKPSTEVTATAIGRRKY